MGHLLRFATQNKVQRTIRTFHFILFARLVYDPIFNVHKQMKFTDVC